MKATIIMPKDAPQTKVDATKGYGGNVISFDRYTEDRNAIANDIQAKTNASLIPPYDHKHVIAGQGTAGKELIEEFSKRGVALDYLFVCLCWWRRLD
jgi:threonine dehydratase